MRIVELIIDEDIDVAGADAIALVNQPAVEEDFFAFSKEDVDVLRVLEGELTKLQTEIIPEDLVDKLLELLDKIGQNPNDLEKDGWVIKSVEDVDLTKERFAISSNPNEASMEDTIGERVRYKYVGPRDSKNRDFCGRMLSANKVFRIEDIDQMTLNNENAEFGSYDIFKYRGSYNCRHKWIKIIYQREGNILNKANIRRGVVDTVDIPQESTLNDATANKRGATQGFSSDLSFIQMSIDEEQRLITGPAAIPNKFIIRAPQPGVSNQPYYVFFSEETIKKIAFKYLKDQNNSNTNIEHTPINLDGVYLVESWIVKNPDNDKSNEFGKKYAPGTWMVTMKVENDVVWRSIKEKKIKGFSIEGYFTESLYFNKEDEQLSLINNILNQVKNDD